MMQPKQTAENIEREDVKGNLPMAAGHKPSERFVRKPIQARSRASKSERVRVADLVSKLVEKIDTHAPANCNARFGGYKPGNGFFPK